MTARLIAEGRHPATAFLYSFARQPKCFPCALHAMTAMLAKNAAAEEGQRLEAGTEDSTTW